MTICEAYRLQHASQYLKKIAHTTMLEFAAAAVFTSRQNRLSPPAVCAVTCVVVTATPAGISLDMVTSTSMETSPAAIGDWIPLKAIEPRSRGKLHFLLVAASPAQFRNFTRWDSSKLTSSFTSSDKVPVPTMCCVVPCFNSEGVRLCTT